MAARVVAGVVEYVMGGETVVALAGVDVEIPTGCLTVIFGPSGSGKSTLLHCLGGLQQLTSGRVELGDADLATLDRAELVELRRRHVAVVFQSFNLHPGLSIRANLELPLLIRGERPDRGATDAVAASLGLTGLLGRFPAQLSGGQQQRVAVARGLLAGVGLLLADEPTGNLDRRSGDEVLGALRRTVDDFGRTVVMATHDQAATAIADRTVQLLDGRIVAISPP